MKHILSTISCQVFSLSKWAEETQCRACVKHLWLDGSSFLSCLQVDISYRRYICLLIGRFFYLEITCGKKLSIEQVLSQITNIGARFLDHIKKRLIKEMIFTARQRGCHQNAGPDSGVRSRDARDPVLSAQRTLNKR